MENENISALRNAINSVADRLENSELPIKNSELINLCFSDVQTVKIADPHIYHEIAEAALNLLLKKKYLEVDSAYQAPDRFLTEIIKPKAAQLPTQTWRSQNQIVRQQFSTPLTISYLLWHLVHCDDQSSLLEPSAGTGCLIIWAKNRIYCNEIENRRRKILRALGFNATNYNAEFIHDFLPSEIQPDCLLINPPFSSNGGRTTRNSSKFGFRHVESALERLKEGGKFGIILGEAGGLDTKTGNDFWRKLSDRIEIKSIIKINGREYLKNGTTVDINLITGRKLSETNKTDWNQALNKIISVSVETVEEGFDRVNQLDLRLDP